MRVSSGRSALPAGRLPIVPAIAEAWRELRNGFVDIYRPELHYMRGPGPKWLQKHDAHTRLDRARSSGRYDERVCKFSSGSSSASVIVTREQ